MIGSKSNRRSFLSSPNVVVLWITLVTLFIRVYRLDAQSLWFDESYSVLITRFSFGDGWQALLADGVHPPLYYWMQKATVGLMGETEFALRFLSVWFGTLAIPLLYQLGKRWVGKRAGVVAALLLALSPFHVWYSQDARMYAALASIALAIMLLFERLLDGGNRTQRIAFVALSGCAYVIHYAALLLPLVQLVYLVIGLKQHARVLRTWVGLQLIAAVPIAGWFVALALRDGQFFGIGWIPKSNIDDILYTLMNFNAGFARPPRVLQWIALAMGVGLVVYGFVRGKTHTRRLIALSAFLPLLALWLISIGRPLYVDRFFIASLPAYLLLIAIGIDALHIKVAVPAAITIAVLLALGTLQLVSGAEHVKEDWRSAGSYLSRAQPDEAIVIRVLQIAVPLSYYYAGTLPLQALDANRQITPLAQMAEGRHGLWLVYWNPHADAHLLAPSARFDMTTETDPTAAAWIAGKGPKLIERIDFTGITIFHFALTQES